MKLIYKVPLAPSMWLFRWINSIISVSAHRKWPEMAVSASTNQVWSKITIRSYAWSFAIQIQIQAVWMGCQKTRKNLTSFMDVPLVYFKYISWTCTIGCSKIFLFASTRIGPASDITTLHANKGCWFSISHTVAAYSTVLQIKVNQSEIFEKWVEFIQRH